MSYTKYKTKGIIIGGSNVGEASRIYNIFTRDFGLVRVRAQGIRELNSKLKSHLQNLFFIEAYLIKGKSGWRVAESYKIKSLPNSFGDNKFKLQSSTRILLFLKRMLPEEDSNIELFDIIVKGLDFMELEGKSLTEEDVYNIERLIVLRILRSLGYVKNSDQTELLLSGTDYNHGLLIKTNKAKSFVTQEINESIKVSDL
jgi:DNA repair protein RecO